MQITRFQTPAMLKPIADKIESVTMYLLTPMHIPAMQRIWAMQVNKTWIVGFMSLFPVRWERPIDSSYIGEDHLQVHRNVLVNAMVERRPAGDLQTGWPTLNF